MGALKNSLLYVFLNAFMFAAAQGAMAMSDSLSVGVEGFHDRYREGNGNHVDEQSRYGSVTLGYRFNTDGGYFSAVDLRGSYGKDDYKSNDGVIRNIPEYEGDARWRFGAVMPSDVGSFEPYMGLAMRGFYDNKKNDVTNLGKYGYDRRILQLYTPIGFTYKFVVGGITFAPNVEFDGLIYGKVNTRQKYLGGIDFDNKQHSGYGWRGEFMMGTEDVQIGPFIRYWKFKDSDFVPVGGGYVATEPRNDRVQAGGTLRVNF